MLFVQQIIYFLRGCQLERRISQKQLNIVLIFMFLPIFNLFIVSKQYLSPFTVLNFE